MNLKPAHILIFVVGASAAAIIGYYTNQALGEGTSSQSLATVDNARHHRPFSSLVSQAPPQRHRAGTVKRMVT
jgi:hypothetical protein